MILLYHDIQARYVAQFYLPPVSIVVGVSVSLLCSLYCIVLCCTMFLISARHTLGLFHNIYKYRQTFKSWEPHYYII